MQRLTYNAAAGKSGVTRSADDFFSFQRMTDVVKEKGAGGYGKDHPVAAVPMNEIMKGNEQQQQF
jgi:hypothetical protein